MSRCKTCKHWKRSSGFDAEYHGAHSGECRSLKFVYSGDSPGEPRTPPDGLEYWDAESYAAGFRTGEDFGCVHHEPPDGGGSNG